MSGHEGPSGQPDVPCLQEAPFDEERCQRCGLLRAQHEAGGLSAGHVFEAGPDWKARAEKAEARLARIDTPEIQDFLKAVENEALHQRERWAHNDDAGKTDADWFWLLGWLGGKAVHATDPAKKLHHIITTAAACLNWHGARTGHYSLMRPGIGDQNG